MNRIVFISNNVGALLVVYMGIYSNKTRAQSGALESKGWGWLKRAVEDSKCPFEDVNGDKTIIDD